ncbi:response regulator receiver protein [Chthoniobacter flavus Ellin428]|uniref:Response regulator receiver protein n=1 Tax=Chthoniobacter flavus Ellin428 TaxID=497964 RepID=B4D4M7_9BACT|nr:helix-turn-helix domain-containing protein [Chthoniobacter flavus]EDY18480.1 response regulator receiver protein [Chthoniobacter flavus Ellin428]
MLSHSQLSVSEIGYALGFEDPSYFARFFRRYEGEARRFSWSDSEKNTSDSPVSTVSGS